jgi:hypothetical protein
MLILRATYSPALRSGMSRTEVAARLPRILSTLNPAGDGIPGRPQIGTPRAWIDAIQTALGPGSSTAQREAAIARALQVAAEARLDDHRRAFGHYIAGRMIQAEDPDLAQRHYATAQSYYDRTQGTELHQAYLSAQMAAHAISRGDGRAALARIGPALAAARDAENAGLLATLMLLQAEAFTVTGNIEAARAVRLDSLGWARYGFGPDWAVRAKMREIAALNPARG